MTQDGPDPSKPGRSDEIKRTVFALFVCPPRPGMRSPYSLRLTPTFTFPISMELSAIVDGCIGMQRFFLQQQLEAAEHGEQAEGAEASTGAMQDAVTQAERFTREDFTVFDADVNPLPQDSKVGSIPKPGIVFVGHRNVAEQIQLVSYAVARRLHGPMPALDSFLAMHHAQFEPVQTYPYDVFLSYSEADAGLAGEVFNRLSAPPDGLKCFMAGTSIEAGANWSDRIRDALAQVKVAVLLLTPKSLKSEWVICEAGAFWALKKRVIPACVYVDGDALPGPLSQFQARPFETDDQRHKLLDEIKRICRE